VVAWIGPRPVGVSILSDRRERRPISRSKVRPFICENGKGSAWLHGQGGESKALELPHKKLDRLNPR